MGREVRRVPADWEHPRRTDGSYQPLYDEDFESAASKWLEGCILWSKGEHPDQHADWAKSAKDCKFFWQWHGDPPEEKYHRPAWPEEYRTHIQMYEDTSEGTPISPVMETPEELARWLADTGASAFGNMTATYEQWLAVCRGGWAPSAVAIVREDGTGEMKSGVAAMSDPID